jgi:hypothetical protein
MPITGVLIYIVFFFQTLSIGSKVTRKFKTFPGLTSFNCQKHKPDDIVTFSGFSIHDGTLLYSKSQYTKVKHSRQLFEHTYTSDPHDLGTLTLLEF